MVEIPPQVRALGTAAVDAYRNQVWSVPDQATEDKKRSKANQGARRRRRKQIAKATRRKQRKKR